MIPKFSSTRQSKGLKILFYWFSRWIRPFQELKHQVNQIASRRLECVMKILRRRQMHCNGASEDAPVLSTTTRDVSSDRGVTIKMSRHWMRPLNTRIYTRTISHLAHTAPYNIHSVSSAMPLCTSHTYLPVYCGDTFELFLHLLIQHGLFFCLQRYASFCAANIFSNSRWQISRSGLISQWKAGADDGSGEGIVN